MEWNRKKDENGKNSMPYIPLGQNKFKEILSYPRLFLPLDKY
jgi:hypothetical protein